MRSHADIRSWGSASSSRSVSIASRTLNRSTGSSSVSGDGGVDFPATVSTPPTTGFPSGLDIRESSGPPCAASSPFTAPDAPIAPPLTLRTSPDTIGADVAMSEPSAGRRGPLVRTPNPPRQSRPAKCGKRKAPPGITAATRATIRSCPV